MTKINKPILYMSVIAFFVIISYIGYSLYRSYQLKKVNDEADAQHEYYQHELEKAAKPH